MQIGLNAANSPDEKEKIRVAQQLQQLGLIEFKMLNRQVGGMARITARGTDVIEANTSPPVADVDRTKIKSELNRLIAEAPRIAPSIKRFEERRDYGNVTDENLDTQNFIRWELEAAAILQQLALSDIPVFIELHAEYLRRKEASKKFHSRSIHVHKIMELLASAIQLMDSALSHSRQDQPRDHLTQLFSRAAFDFALTQIATRASVDTPASLVMADIDHFKKVNDGLGHQTGDAVLKEVAQRLLTVVDGKGQAYRYGGEEFAVILPNHTTDEAISVAERARISVEANKIEGLVVTSSYGIATVPVHATSPEEWLKRADDALYDAKRLGRNLVRVAGEPPPQPDQRRQPSRKQATSDILSDEIKEKLRLEILRHGRALCPKDKIPLDVIDTTTLNSLGRDFIINCPACGLSANLDGPQRQ